MTAVSQHKQPYPFVYQGAPITIARIHDLTCKALSRVPDVRYPSGVRKAIIEAATNNTESGQLAAELVDEVARCLKFGLHAVFEPEEPHLKKWFQAVCDLAAQRARQIPDEDALPSCITKQEVGLHMVKGTVQARYGSVVRAVPAGSLLPHPHERQGPLTDHLGELDPFREDSVSRLKGNGFRNPELLVQEFMEQEAVDQRGTEESLHDEVRQRILGDCSHLGITFSTTRALPVQLEGIMSITYSNFQLSKAIGLKRLARQQEERTARYATEVTWQGSRVLRLAKLPDQREVYEPLPQYLSLEELAGQINAIFAQTLELKDAHKLVQNTWHTFSFGRTPQSVMNRCVERMLDEIAHQLTRHRTAEQPKLRRMTYAIAMETFGEATPMTIALTTYQWLCEERSKTEMSDAEHLMVNGLRSRRALYDALRVKARSAAENETLMPLLREFAPSQYERIVSLLKEVEKASDPAPKFTESVLNTARELERNGLKLGAGLKAFIGLV